MSEALSRASRIARTVNASAPRPIRHLPPGGDGQAPAANDRGRGFGSKPFEHAANEVQEHGDDVTLVVAFEHHRLVDVYPVNPGRGHGRDETPGVKPRVDVLEGARAATGHHRSPPLI